MMIIRPIKPQDNKPLAFLIRSVLSEHGAKKPGTVYFDPTTDDLYALFQEPLSQYWVIEDNSEVLGGSGIFPTVGLPEGCCELVKLYLNKATRGKGWGKILIEHCLKAAAKAGFKQVYLETMPELSSAIGLYKKLGFKFLPAPLGKSGHFGCDIWMLKMF